MRKFLFVITTLFLLHHSAVAGGDSGSTAAEDLLQLQGNGLGAFPYNYGWVSTGEFYTKVMSVNLLPVSVGGRVDDLTAQMFLRLIHYEQVQDDVLSYGWASVGVFYGGASPLRVVKPGSLRAHRSIDVNFPASPEYDHAVGLTTEYLLSLIHPQVTQYNQYGWAPAHNAFVVRTPDP
jgi:hypothetical protein